MVRWVQVCGLHYSGKMEEEGYFTDENTVKFYTGLPKLSVLNDIFDHVSSFTTSSKLFSFESLFDSVCTALRELQNG